MYDISNYKSFEAVDQKWVKDIKNKLPVVLVGNKSDLPDHRRRVSMGEGNKLALKYEFDFLETSAEEDVNVKETFNLLINKLCGFTFDERFNENYALKDDKNNCC